MLTSTSANFEEKIFEPEKNYTQQKDQNKNTKEIEDEKE